MVVGRRWLSDLDNVKVDAVGLGNGLDGGAAWVVLSFVLALRFFGLRCGAMAR